MSVCLYPGFVFTSTHQSVDRQGNPTDWPEGMTVRIRVITAGTGSAVLTFTENQIISGTYMYLSLTPEETIQIPRGAEMFVDVNFGDGWRPWRRGRVGQCN